VPLAFDPMMKTWVVFLLS